MVEIQTSGYDSALLPRRSLSASGDWHLALARPQTWPAGIASYSLSIPL